VADGEPESDTRSRRRRDADAPGGLSVADLLARHGADVSARQANQHSLRPEPVAEEDQTTEFFPGRGYDPRLANRNGPGRAKAGIFDEDERQMAERFFPREENVAPRREPDAQPPPTQSPPTAPRGRDRSGVDVLTVETSAADLFDESAEDPSEPEYDAGPRSGGSGYFDGGGGSGDWGESDTDGVRAVGLDGGAPARSGRRHAATRANAVTQANTATPAGGAPRAGGAPGRDVGGPSSGDVGATTTGAGATGGGGGGRHGRHGARPEGSAEPSAAPDSEEPAALEGFELRAAKIDETLTRLTAIHAGLGREATARVSHTGKLPLRVQPEEPAADEVLAPPSGLRRAGRIGAVVLAAALFLALGTGWVTQLWLDGKLRSVDALDPDSAAVVDADAQRGDQNYLLVGSDLNNPAPAGDPLAQGTPPAQGAEPSNSAVSTVLLAHVPAKRDRVVMLSLPANLEVDRPNCDRYDPGTTTYPGGTTPAQSSVPLASAYQIGGPRCVTKTVQQLTGLAINHFTELDLAGVQDMVDAVRGLVLCVPKPVVDGVLGPVAPTQGRQIMGGQTALAYARAQHVPGDPPSGGGQTLRQQMLLTALLARGSSDQVVGNLSELSKLVGAFGAHSLNDNTDLEQLGTLASALHDTDQTKVDFLGVPTADQPDTQGNQVLRPDDAKKLFDTIREDKPLAGEGATASDESNTVARDAASSAVLPPSAITLTVRNGSSHAGVANQVADSLRTLGFTVAGVGDAPHSADGKTIIRNSPDEAAQAAALATSVPDAQTESVSGTGILQLVLGDSFDGQVRAAAPASGPAQGPALVTAASASCPGQ
jgi:LCP family protein required for cell wall assembly